MSGVLVFWVPQQFEMNVLREKIGEVFTIQETGDKTVNVLHYDTFDWRLFKAGMILSRQAVQYTLARNTGEVLCQGGGTRKKKPFVWDFQEEALQKCLKPVVEVRVLLPQFSLSSRMSHFGLLNADEKTVLRLTLVEAAGQSDKHQFTMPPVLLVETLRGYYKASQRVCNLLASSGLTKCEDGYDLVAQVHNLLSIDPKATDSKFSVELSRMETVAEAVRDICLNLRSVMMLNIPGVIDDIDTEFLHDLRVSVRRTRSLLSLMKKQLPTVEIDHFQKELKWLGNVTGPVRDLDVYLLKTDEYRAMLPSELHGGLTCFFAGLSRQRKKELRLLREHLRSSRFTKLLEKWRLFLMELPTRDEYPQGKRLCCKVAEKIIRKRFARLLRDGAQITPISPQEKLHELRIEGKKFRYILEFFRSLFNADGVDVFLRQMKKLQNNLGDYNDAAVQKRMLVKKLTYLKSRDDQTVEMAAALGGLIVHLNDQQNQIRVSFEEIFKNFAEVENTDLLEHIFSDAESGSGGE